MPQKLFYLFLELVLSGCGFEMWIGANKQHSHIFTVWAIHKVKAVLQTQIVHKSVLIIPDLFIRDDYEKRKKCIPYV